MTREERNALVLSLLEQVTPLVYKYAAAYGLDREEARQDASIDIMSVLDAGIERIDNLPAYITLRVKSRIINKFHYSKYRQAASLDAPISDQDDAPTLADLLPDPHQAEPSAILLTRERIQEALERLPSLHQSTRRMARDLGATALASYGGVTCWE